MKAFSNSYEVGFSFMKNFAKNIRNQRYIVDCRFSLEQSEAAL